MGSGGASGVTFLSAVRHPERPELRTSPMRAHPAPGTTGGWRLLRGAVVGGAATTLAVGAHCLAGGRPPTWTTVVSLALLLGIVSTWLSGVRWSLPRLLALFIAAEAGMHAVFAASLPVHAPGSEHHTPPLASAGGLAAEHAAPLLPSTPAMVTVHVMAAALTALVLSRGEALLGGVLDALALRLFRLLDAAPVLVEAPQTVPVRVLRVPGQGAFLDVRRQRGPPR